MSIWQKLELTSIKDNKGELLNELKKIYNHYIGRLKKAEGYYNNPTTTAEMVDKTLNNYNKVIIALTKLQDDYRDITGNEMPYKNKHEGF